MISGKDSGNSFLLLLVPMLFIGLILQIIHLPEVISLNRPDFLTLIILFFAIYSNFSLKIETSWLVGIFLGLATGAPLGINALIISAQIYLITTQFKNFYKYKIWQQVIIVGIINFLVTILCYWVEESIMRMPTIGSPACITTKYLCPYLTIYITKYPTFMVFCLNYKYTIR